MGTFMRLHFASERAMVWQKITIGFTVAGFVAVWLPDAFWQAVFIAEKTAKSPPYFAVVLENALLTPFVPAAAFIGSRGNIPPATVLNSSGVLFAGIQPDKTVRLHFEIWREAAPYIGVSWSRKLGDTKDPAQEEGDDTDVISFVEGLRVWF